MVWKAWMGCATAGMCTAESALSTACRRDEVDGPRAGENHALLLVGDLTSLFVAPLLGLALKVRWEGGVASVARAGPHPAPFLDDLTRTHVCGHAGCCAPRPARIFWRRCRRATGRGTLVWGLVPILHAWPMPLHAQQWHQPAASRRRPPLCWLRPPHWACGSPPSLRPPLRM